MNVPGYASPWPLHRVVQLVAMTFDAARGADGGRRIETRDALGEALTKARALGDFGGECPPRVFIAMLGLVEQWHGEGEVVRRNRIERTAWSAVQLALAYTSGSIDAPRVASVADRVAP